MHNNLLLANPAGDEKLYIEDVFSTYLYTGNGSTQTITNGIDLAGKGGLVWTKRRDDASVSHILIDTVRGTGSQLYSNTTGSQGISTNLITAFNSNGYSIGASTAVNASGSNTASWTFRKEPKFFDVVTWTGNGQARTISHSLGVTPGMIIVKRTDNVGSWIVWHRGLTNQTTGYLVLNDAVAQATSTLYWNSTAPTATQFSIGTQAAVNASGGSYVAYLFAHDTTADGIVQCGSYTTDGSGNATVNLGWEPQFVLFKASSTTGSWRMYDNMRGIATGGNDAVLYANLSSAEDTASNAIDLNATGFSVSGQSASATFIYLAIRRGPMRTPTDATKVFNSQIYTGDYTTSTPITGMNPGTDVWWNARRTPGSGFYDLDRLRGWSFLQTSASTAENISFTWSQQTQTSLLPSAAWWGSSVSQVSYFFNRAPGFFDVVCYTGTGSAITQAHNLGVVPELMIVKCRNGTDSWYVYSSSLPSASYYVRLNTTGAQATSSGLWNNTAPTSSVFSVGTGLSGSGNTYVAYLFASCPGVSKVGSYTGTGTTNQIDCGFTNGARFVLIKRTDSTGDWYVWDTARGVIAGNDPYLLLNSTAVEVTNTDYIDPLSTGFEISSTAPAAINANGGTFIYLAIA